MDEAQTGLGRTGQMYAFERDGVAPDILTLSKTLGAGLPVAMVITSAEIEEACYERNYLFYTTHVSDPLAAAVARTVLNVIERDGLVARAASLGKVMSDRFAGLKEKYEVVGDVRGRGLLQGIELVGNKVSRKPVPALGAAVTAACLERGLHMNIVQLPGAGAGIFRIAPPMTITDDDLAKGLDILARPVRCSTSAAVVSRPVGYLNRPLHFVALEAGPILGRRLRLGITSTSGRLDTNPVVRWPRIRRLGSSRCEGAARTWFACCPHHEVGKAGRSAGALQGK